MPLPLPPHVQELITEARILLIAHLDKGDWDTWANYLAKREELATTLDLDGAIVHRMLLAGDFNG
jgi:hypothetical protein